MNVVQYWCRYAVWQSNVFNFEEISFLEYGIALLLAFAIIPLVEIVKAFERMAMKKKENKPSEAIDSKQLVIAMDELEKEKGIKKEYLILLQLYQ